MLSLKLPKKIAITGGIASGKSTVCHLFEEFGAFCVSADEIVHQLLVPTTRLGQDVIALLGTDIVEGERISRERIAQKVFSNPSLLKELEKCIHPEVQKDIEAKYKIAAQKQAPLFVAEVPLLYEAGQEKFYDMVIVVTCNKSSCQKRFRYDENEYNRRSQRLMPIEDKVKRANLIIDNNNNLEDLRKIVQITYNLLKDNI